MIQIPYYLDPLLIIMNFTCIYGLTTYTSFFSHKF